MASTLTTGRAFMEKARPLLLSYWIMPLATGFAVIATAAGMLTETLVLANNIDATVMPIKESVAAIKVHTDTIAVLNQVDASAKGIRSAADPLSGQAGTILSTVGAIQSTVGQIDAVTGSIRTRAAAIDNTVTSIAPHVLGIAVPAESINRRLTTTMAELNTVISLVMGIKGDTATLIAPGYLPTIDDHAHSIDCKVGNGSCAS